MPSIPRLARLVPLLAVVVSVLVLGPVFPLQPADAAPADAGVISVPDELLVGFQGGVDPGAAEAVYRSHGAAKIEQILGLNVHRIRVAPSALGAVASALAKRPEVKFVEPNKRLPPSTSDPYFSSEWHLSMIGAPSAWTITQGSASVVIAILDSGIDPSHPDLAAKLLPGYNFVSNNTSTGDWNGHGTLVAGAAAAIGNNSVGVAGVAGQNNILPVVIADSTGYALFSTIASGITWAADRGAKVANLSYAATGSSTVTSAAQYAVNKGMIVIVAAGNCGCVDSTPANPYIISVSGTDSSDNLASWSSRGNFVDISAPGVSIYTTTSGGGYGAASGTSLASPVVAGVAALMFSANPSLSPSNVATLLQANADDLGAAGWDPSFGYGRVNAYRAVAAATASAPPPDTTPPTATITSPASGSTLAGTVTVAASASDDTSVARVDLYVDGAFYGSDTTSPYGFAWGTATVINGSHTLTAKAVDGAGNVGTSATVTVTVNNVADTSSPTATITSTSTSGTKLNVSVSASDNVAVAKVELYVDGGLAGTDTAAPYNFAVNLNSLALGTHTLQAKAYDNAGNVNFSTPVSFTKATTRGKK